MHGFDRSGSAVQITGTGPVTEEYKWIKQKEKNSLIGAQNMKEKTANSIQGNLEN